MLASWTWEDKPQVERLDAKHAVFSSLRSLSVTHFILQPQHSLQFLQIADMQFVECGLKLNKGLFTQLDFFLKWISFLQFSPKWRIFRMLNSVDNILKK